ncbi:arabinose-5-phosphate isomerase [Mucilaginibacter oryzae]|uniref:Arabinose-5-phosphate isomerase n=1 Tax=Mucilaginibacter oryzae TaxID=468058 RepID=A0A316HBF7_9SPHI|nr:KpsF/GutQ family sugar-phosphate isomerase [Mucilaginibacter oryzae]PWK77737.1 arabinose-5-phosphate isomerase [Mucilaginibacter oryzae]
MFGSNSSAPRNYHFDVEGINAIANEVIDIEASAILNLKSLNNDSFCTAIGYLINASGRVIICGLGKSGLIGKKISATLASTGTPSFFLHPAEAIHGDLGMIMSNDAIITISYSGETDEVLKLVPIIKKLGIPHISITGNPNSTLAKNSDCSLNVHVAREACALQLAPTSSTTATLVIGDALAVALMKLKNFKEHDFAQFHPGGSLGRQLLCKVSDEMVIDPLPVIRPDDKIKEVIMSIGSGQLGVTVVIDEADSIIGIITDGDLRRAMSKFEYDNGFFNLTASDIMSKNPKRIRPGALIAEAESMMNENKINSLIVEDNNKLVGILYQRKLKYGTL